MTVVNWRHSCLTLWELITIVLQPLRFSCPAVIDDGVFCEVCSCRKATRQSLAQYANTILTQGSPNELETTRRKERVF